jgi:hypothetical protein
MARFSIDLRGFNEAQREFVAARILQLEVYRDLSILDIRIDSITIELSTAQEAARILHMAHGTCDRISLT